jgi:hypothetical protein
MIWVPFWIVGDWHYFLLLIQTTFGVVLIYEHLEMFYFLHVYAAGQRADAKCTKWQHISYRISSYYSAPFSQVSKTMNKQMMMMLTVEPGYCSEVPDRKKNSNWMLTCGRRGSKIESLHILSEASASG